MLDKDYPAFLLTFEQDRFQALRLNPLKKVNDRDIPFVLTPVSWAENGFYYAKDCQPGRHPYHEAGAYYIQEPSAMAVAPLLEAKPGETVLDLCAAPGGKSTQLGAMMGGKGLLVCNEIHPARARILSENIERMGIVNACVTNETPARLAERFPAYFDRILVDAPCSGEGMFRKNEAACEEWSPENVDLCAKRQDEILDSAAVMLKPGGRLVYSTCTFAPQENEGSIRRFLERHGDFALLPIDKRRMGLPDGACDGRNEWGGRCAPKTPAGESAAKADLSCTLRLWPHLVKGEGHFAAVLQKAGSVPEHYSPTALSGMESGIDPKERELEPWREFWKDTARRADGEAAGAGELAELFGMEQAEFLRFGDNLYLTPRQTPALKGLKVLRPGLHLGVLKKNRFEPSHALALALRPEHVRHVCHFSAEDPILAAYLGGQTFPFEGDKGWYLIAADSYSIGWGKSAGGVMKNHYPKGLRKG